MRRILALFSSLAAWAVLLPPAQTLRAEPEDAPAIAVDEAVYDWGSIFHGQVVERRFKLTNRGATAVTIREIKTNCGCTFSGGEADGKTLAPGESIDVSLRVESSKLPADQLARGEPVRKSGTVVTSEGRNAATFWLQGSVLEVLRFDRESAKLEWIRGVAGAKPVTVEASVLVDKPVRVLSARCDGDLARARVIEKAPGKLFEITLEPVEPSADARALQSGALQLAATVGGHEVEIPLPVYLTIRQRVECQPSASFFFTKKDTQAFRDGGEAPAKTIDIESIGPDEHRFRILSVRAEMGAATAKVETVREGRHYRLTVTLEPIPVDATRLVREQIIIATDDPLVPEIKITGSARL